MANLPANSHMFHLRRIAPNQQPSHQDHAHSHGASNLHNQATLLLLDTFVKFGRNHELCDVVLTSSFSASNMISRDHAEITGVKTASGRIEKYHITHHSLNGTYINDRRCRNRVPTQINEGDIIKFGHMNGASIKENQMAPQASAEFAFVVERAMAPYQYLGFRDGRRVHPIICRGDVLNCSEGEQRTIDAREPINTSVGVKSSSAAVHNAQLLLDGSTTRPVQPVPPTAHLTAAHHHLGALPSSSTTTPSVVGSSIPPSGHHHSSAALNTTPAAASPSTLNFFPYGTTNLASFYPYSGLPSNLFAPANSITQWNLQQAQAAISGFRAPNVFGSAGLPPATSSSFLQRGFLPQASSALVNSLLTPVTAAAVLQAQAQHQHHQQQQHQQQQQQQHQQQQHDAAALAAAAAASVASVSHPVGKTAAEQYQQQLHAHQQQQLQQQQQHQLQLQQQHLQSRVAAPAADTTLPSKPAVEIRQQTVTTTSVHMPAKAAPPVVATAPVVAAPAAPPAKVTPIASPPMECDSSVPSPPKAIVAADSSTNSQTIGVQPISGTTKLPSPTNLRKEDDQRSERSFAESPPPRRAPAPAPWDSTPSPRPRDTPDRDSVAKEKEQQQKEKEKQREEERKADNKKPAAAPVTKHRKTNEIARLLDDLTETSWANQVKRVSTNSRRPAEEVLLEKSAKKEKKKKEKERARREREETEQQQQQRKSALAQPPSSSTSNAANASSSSANRLASTDPKRRLKQLSDEESVSSSDSSEEGEGVGTGERRRLSSNGTSALSSAAAKKEAMKRRKSSARSSDEESSESSSDDDAESDDSSAKKKNKKRARKSSTSATSLKANKLAASKKRSSVGTATGKGKPGKAARKKSSASYSSSEPEPVVLSAQATVDENGDPVTHHDPTSTCGLAKQCTRPQDEQVRNLYLLRRLRYLVPQHLHPGSRRSAYGSAVLLRLLQKVVVERLCEETDEEESSLASSFY